MNLLEKRRERREQRLYINKDYAREIFPSPPHEIFDYKLNLQQQKYENLGYQKAVRNNRLFFTIILSTWKKFHAKMNLLEALEFQGDFQTNVGISKTSIK